MKHTFKRLLLFALALVLVVSLLPGLAAEAHAAAPNTASGFTLQVTNIWCTEGCELHNIGASAVTLNKITTVGTSSAYPGAIMIRYYWDDDAHSDGCPVDAQLSERNWVQYMINDFDCTKEVNITTVVSKSANAPAHQIHIYRAATDHNLTYTQLENEQHQGTCSLCEKTVTADCTYSAATCKTPATCTTCGRTKGDVDSDAHIWGDWTSNGEGKHTRKCTLKETHRETAICSGGTATCTEAAVCTDCKTAYGEPLGHTPGAVTVTGNKAEVKCTRYDTCGYVGTVALNVPKSGGTYTGDPVRPAVADYSANWPWEKNDITYTNNINVGTATAKLAVPGGEISVDFEIEARDIGAATVTVTPASGVYTGARHENPTTVVVLNGTTLTEGVDYTVNWSTLDLTKAAGYTARVFGTGNYQGETTASYEISKAEINVTFTQKEPLAYTGEEQTPVVEPSTTVSNTQPITFSYSKKKTGDTYTSTLPSFTEVGTHTVYYKASAKNHTTAIGSFTIEISKAVNEWTTMPLAKGWTYGQTPSLPTGGAKFGEFTVTYTGKTNAGDDYASEDTPTEAGDYKAIFTVAETDNYAGLTKEVPFTIERAVLTAEDFTYTEPTDLVYNGKNQHPNLVSCVVAPAGVSISQVKLNYQNADTGNDEFAIDAGNYTFYIRLEETANYAAVAKLTRDDFKFIVHKADPVISWDATEFTYDGTEHGAAKVTLVNDETYTGGIDYTCTKGSDVSGNLPVDAGTYKLTASIDEQKNYNAASKETTITINPKTITPAATIDSDTFTYNGLPCSPTVVVSNGSDPMAGSDYTVDCSNNVNPGVATMTVKPTQDSNYTFDEITLYFLILPDISDLDGITPENVTSAYQELIDEIQEQMDGVDISTVSQNAQDEWNEIVEYLKELEDAIKEIQEQMQEIIDETAALPDHPTGDDLDKIDDLLDLYDEIKDQLTDEEKEDLADEIEKLQTEKEHIEETNETFEEVVADAEEILDKDLTYKDKDDVEDILDRINDLLEDPHLTEEQKETLEDLKDQLEDIMDAFDAAAEVEEMIDELPKTGEPDDEDIRDAYEEAKEAYEALGEDKDLVNPNAVAKLEKLAKALRDYKIIKGNGQRWYTNAEEVVDLYFTANGPYSKFAYVKIDGELLDSKYYTSREGSTIVGLKASYLETLGYAKHTITIGYEDGELSGEATGYFRVTLHTDSPLTGDTTNIVLISALGLSSLAALAVLVVMRKKRSV